jgi:hypothetical protein
MQPAMGYGCRLVQDADAPQATAFAASTNHAAFGIGLYAAALLVAADPVSN